MPLFRGISKIADERPLVAAIGNFDGVHIGHQAMMTALRRQGDAIGARAIAMTFDPPPVELLRPDFAPPRLMRLPQKAAWLEAAGADAVVALPTDRALLELSAEEFFHDVLIGRLGVRGLVEGPNFRFGRDRRGDIPLLETLCRRAAIPLTIVAPVEVDGRMVSSSLVRQCVGEGDLPGAARLLGRPHEVLGTVVHGSDRGERLGFPTANLADITTLLPPDGVFAGRVEVDGRLFAAAIHIGSNSTFDETDRRFEAHLLDFSGDLYGRLLRVELLDRVRGSVRFETPDALIEQLRLDCDRVRTLVAAASQHR